MNTPDDDRYQDSGITVEVPCANCGDMIAIFGSYREVEDKSYRNQFCKRCLEDGADG